MICSGEINRMRERTCRRSPGGLRATSKTFSMGSHASVNHGKTLDRLAEQIDSTETDVTESETNVSLGGFSGSCSSRGRSTRSFLDVIDCTPYEGDVRESSSSSLLSTKSGSSFSSSSSAAADRARRERAAQRKKQFDEAMAFAKECRTMSREHELASERMERQRRNVIPYADETLSDVPVQQRPPLRRDRLQGAKQRVVGGGSEDGTKYGTNNEGRNASSSFSGTCESQSQAKENEFRENEMEKAQYMTLRELKQRLQDRDISCDHFLYKSQFVEAYVAAIVKLKMAAWDAGA